jgi:hypothetical protein
MPDFDAVPRFIRGASGAMNPPSPGAFKAEQHGWDGEIRK